LTLKNYFIIFSPQSSKFLSAYIHSSQLALYKCDTSTGWLECASTRHKLTSPVSFFITRTAWPAGTSFLKIVVKYFDTCLNVNSIASNLRWSRW